MGTLSCYTSTWFYITTTVATAHVSNCGAAEDGPQMSIRCQLLRSVAIETAISTASSLDAEAPLSTLINVPVRKKVADYPLRGRRSSQCHASRVGTPGQTGTLIPKSRFWVTWKGQKHHLVLGHDEDCSEEIEGANSVIALVEINVDSRMMKGENLSSEPVSYFEL